MAIDPVATAKDYSLIIYNKTEIDALYDAEVLRVDTQLDLKSLKSDEGAPSGIATLDVNGLQSAAEIPAATFLEAADDTVTSKVITPSSLNYQIDSVTVKKSTIGVAEGIAPLGADNLVPSSYLPASQNVQTFVEATLTEMYAITTALVGDRCVVTSEADLADNGEYVANIDYPVDGTGWDLLPNVSAVQSVNTLTGNVTITSISESAANAGRLDTAETTILSNTGRLDTVEPLVTTNTNGIASNVTAIGLKADQTALDTTNGTVSGHTTLIAANALQTSLDITNTAVDLNTTFRLEHTYNYNNVENVVVTNDAYEEVNRLTTGTLSAGLYEISLSMIYTLNSTTTGAYFRFSFDGGSTWHEVRRESKDVADKIPVTYITVDAFAGGIKDIVIQSRKENASDTLTILNQTIIYQRKA